MAHNKAPDEIDILSTRVSIAGVSERDIDLLLLEEFQSSPLFQAWFVSQVIGVSVDLGVCVSAKRSVTHSTGESDLEVTFLDSNKSLVRLLIENKVDASLQPQQAERYRKRGEAYVSHGECSTYHTVIVAPARYFGAARITKGFDSYMTYETILDWFAEAKDLGDRRHYKVSLLQSAIDKGTLGYQPEEDAATTAFWHQYWLCACEYSPALEMREPGPRRGGFIPFFPLGLPPGIDITHKLPHGHVDLQISDMGSRLQELRSAVGSYLEDEMSVSGAAKSAAVRIKVPTLDTHATADSQMKRIRAGLDAANRLLGWYHRHEGVFSRFLPVDPLLEE